MTAKFWKMEDEKQTLAEEKKVNSNHLQETKSARIPLCPKEESSEIRGSSIYFRKGRKNGNEKKKGLAKNLHKGQLDSQVLAVRPNNKEAVSPDIGRGLEVHALELLELQMY